MSSSTYEQARRQFDWAAVYRDLGWNDGERVDVGNTIVDRHGQSHCVALYWISKEGRREIWTYADLKRLSDKVAYLLRGEGIRQSDHVAGVLSRRPESIAIMLGVWKVGAVYVPVFTGFGAEAVGTRIRGAQAKVVFVHQEHRHKVPAVEGVSVIAIAADKGIGIERGDISFWHAIAGRPQPFDNALCDRSDPAVILYTSGSTGEPKGVLIASNFLAAVRPYMQFSIDLQPSDTFWPTGDPGWGYGLVCYHVALSMGHPVVSFEGAPTPEACLQILEEHQVTNLATVPTLLRGIMALGKEAFARYRLVLAKIGSCGEPLNSEVIRFFQETCGIVPTDTFGSSENGLPLGNFSVLDVEVRPGSMGLPMPGFDMTIVDDEGRELPTGEVGYLAQRQSDEGRYALGYWNNPERTAELFRDGWIIAGDMARRDESGYFWFEGRSDDVIKTSGYRVGPFEVESALLHHPSIAEAGVIGVPDSLKGNIIKAFVVLKSGYKASATLTRELQEVAKEVVGRHAYPREIEFVSNLPKTDSGKIQRFKLREQANQQKKE